VDFGFTKPVSAPLAFSFFQRFSVRRLGPPSPLWLHNLFPPSFATVVFLSRSRLGLCIHDVLFIFFLLSTSCLLFSSFSSRAPFGKPLRGELASVTFFSNLVFSQLSPAPFFDEANPSAELTHFPPAEPLPQPRPGRPFVFVLFLIPGID